MLFLKPDNGTNSQLLKLIFYAHCSVFAWYNVFVQRIPHIWYIVQESTETSWFPVIWASSSWEIHLRISSQELPKLKQLDYKLLKQDAVNFFIPVTEEKKIHF